jgi:AcrR family transcriptional regulator
VTVAEIAREAGVAEKTVFNDFPTTGDLVYWRLEDFEAQLLAAIRERPVGESALDACGRFQTAQRGWLAAKDPQARESMIAVARARLAREAGVQAQRTLDTLAQGLGGYAVKGGDGRADSQDG